MGRFSAALAAAALAGCGEKEEPDADVLRPSPEQQLLGRWHGRLSEKGADPFELTVTIASLERAKPNAYRYTGIDCSGVWRFLGPSDGAYRFRELYEGGGGPKCVEVGTVT